VKIFYSCCGPFGATEFLFSPTQKKALIFKLLWPFQCHRIFLSAYAKIGFNLLAAVAPSVPDFLTFYHHFCPVPECVNTKNTDLERK